MPIVGPDYAPPYRVPTVARHCRRGYGSGGLEIDYQLELSRLIDRQFGRILAFENPRSRGRRWRTDKRPMTILSCVASRAISLSAARICADAVRPEGGDWCKTRLHCAE